MATTVVSLSFVLPSLEGSVYLRCLGPLILVNWLVFIWGLFCLSEPYLSSTVWQNWYRGAGPFSLGSGDERLTGGY